MTLFWSLVKIYFLIFILRLGLLYLIEYLMNKFKLVLIKYFKKRNKQLIKTDNRIKLIRNLRLELQVENLSFRLTPYLPYLSRYREKQEIGLIINQKNSFIEMIKDYGYMLSPLRLINIVIIIVILEFNGVSLLMYLQQLFSWLITHPGDLRNALLAIPSTVALLLILSSWFSISRKGMLARAKGKVNLEDFENIVKFHKKNRMLLSDISTEGFNNITKVLGYRKRLITTFGKDSKEFDDTCNQLYDFLKNIPKIKELDTFVQEHDQYKDLYPFIFIGNRHLVFQKMQSIYMERDSHSTRLNKLEKIFCTKEKFKNIIKNLKKYYSKNFEDHLDNHIIGVLKEAVLIQEYLNRIHPQFYKRYSLFSVLSFITNKDK
ncbi:hypothetical protein SFC42_17425 [Priestia filamentosa]|uniref:hypothetical protein n=1 Tax=Priestia filamentosa TaxID=1402861 RepID=UPI00398364F9